MCTSRLLAKPGWIVLEPGGVRGLCVRTPGLLARRRFLDSQVEADFWSWLTIQDINMLGNPELFPVEVFPFTNSVVGIVTSSGCQPGTSEIQKFGVRPAAIAVCSSCQLGDSPYGTIFNDELPLPNLQAIDYYHRALTLDRNDVFSAEMLNFAITEALDRGDV
eukprot:s980_g3.t1